MAPAFLTLKPSTGLAQRRLSRNTNTAHAPPRCSLNPQQLCQKEVVFLGSQRVGDEGATAVSQALRSVGSRIRMVNLDSCDVTCSGAAALAEGIRGNSVLEELVLYDNAIGDDGAAALAEALSSPGSVMRVLSLPRNRIGSRGGAALGRMIGENTALQTVYLMGQVQKGGGMGDEGASAWAEGIRKNNGKFWFVNLKGNDITEKGLEHLRSARVDGKHVVFPADPYPGPKTGQSKIG